MSNAKLLYTSSKVYKEAGVAVAVVVVDVVVTTVVKTCRPSEEEGSKSWLS